MTELQDWFAYTSFRPGQEEMLNKAAFTARTGGALLIDAPTGSGKSSNEWDSAKPLAKA